MSLSHGRPAGSYWVTSPRPYSSLRRLPEIAGSPDKWVAYLGSAYNFCVAAPGKIWYCFVLRTTWSDLCERRVVLDRPNCFGPRNSATITHLLQWKLCFYTTFCIRYQAELTLVPTTRSQGDWPAPWVSESVWARNSILRKYHYSVGSAEHVGIIVHVEMCISFLSLSGTTSCNACCTTQEYRSRNYNRKCQILTKTPKITQSFALNFLRLQ